MLWHPLFSLLTSLGGSFFGERVVIGMTWKFCQEESRKSMETTPLCPFWTIWKEGNGRFLKEWRIRFFTENFLHLHHFPLVSSASSTLLTRLLDLFVSSPPIGAFGIPLYLGCTPLIIIIITILIIHHENIRKNHVF